MSDHSKLGNFNDVEECGRNVITNGYQFFIYDPNDGECLYETTASSDCPEGWVSSSYYDFYAAYDLEETTPEPEELETTSTPEFSVVLIAETSSCKSESL